jgi:hypothetical protein
MSDMEMLRQLREDKRDSPPVDLRLRNDEDPGKAVNAKAIRTRNSFERVGIRADSRSSGDSLGTAG